MNQPKSVGAYNVVDRLLALRDLLREQPQTWENVCKSLPDDYQNNESGKRKFRRDLTYLKRWGYRVERDSATQAYTLAMPQIEFSWTDEELAALAALRTSFVEGTPYAKTLQTLLRKIEQGMNRRQAQVYARKPTLTIKFAPTEEQSAMAATRTKLEEAIEQHQRIRFQYKPADRLKIILHPDDEPIELFFEDGHYYLWTYCYKMSRTFKFRVDMIVPNSVEILPKRAEGRWKQQLVHFRYWLSPKIAERGVSPRFPEMVAIDIGSDERGGAIVTAGAYSDFDAIQGILRYGEHAEILDPDRLRVKMRHVVEQMSKLYRRGVE